VRKVRTMVYDKAMLWIDNNKIGENDGIVITDTQRIIYPEVTGYFIPSLIRAGRIDEAVGFARTLLAMQDSEGAWRDASQDKAVIFDAGQILKGLLAIREYEPGVDNAIIKGIDWVLSNMDESGHLIQPDYESRWVDKSHSNELIQIYCISPILEAAKVFGRSDYKEKAEKILDYYIDRYYSQITNYSMFSHFYAYVIEGLIDCGRIEIAKEAMRNLEKYRKENGAVQAYNDVQWVCSTALFQFSIIWYKLGEVKKADATYEYACSLQNESGGWYGSYDSNVLRHKTNRVMARLGKTRAMYLKDQEISWAVKFFLDATEWKKESEKN